MTHSGEQPWLTANQRYLTAALGVVQALLTRHTESPASLQAAEQALALAAAVMPAPAAIETLSAGFGLSPFERALLLMCAGVELSTDFAAVCTPTFGLAMAVLPEPQWDASVPSRPLRRWRLLEVGPGPTLMSSPLRLDERVLHYLTGVSYLDERLARLLDRLAPGPELAPSHQALAERLAGAWAQHDTPTPLPVLHLAGWDAAEKRAIAASACALLHLQAHVLAAPHVPTAPDELDTLLRLWEREAIMLDSALVLDCDDLEPTDLARQHAIARLAEHTLGGVILLARHRRQLLQRPVLTFEVQQPTTAEQQALWQSYLGPLAPGLNGHVDQLVAHFNLGASGIQAACTTALHTSPAPASVESLAPALWDACRAQARPRLDDLAQAIPPTATWDDLVLPEAQRATLRDLAAHVRQRLRVYETWGFARKGARGLGISALFAGGSGTGKTMAAEVLAHTLRLDLYHIDLSGVVSKYIGETEKNLRRIFDAAEAGGVLLLFDEADALFGKRSEVKDSHDRHANIEVSYLLQRMEAYRGLSILTTNMKDALDPAFLRRLRFVVPFPFPDAAQRADIWRRVFPAQTPTEGLDIEKLARLNVAGGNIRNIALNAAFLAAEADTPVRMEHVLQATRSEYARLEKPLTAGEIKEWVGV